MQIFGCVKYQNEPQYVEAFLQFTLNTLPRSKRIVNHPFYGKAQPLDLRTVKRWETGETGCALLKLN